MPKKQKHAITPAIKEAVLLLRYHKKKPVSTDTKFMTLAKIAKMLDIAYHQVSYICRRVYLNKKRKATSRVSARVIEDEQAAYLQDTSTLRAWAGRSLAERAILYHRRFPHKLISAMELCRFYKRNKITRKAVTRFKAASVEKQAEYAAWQQDTYTAL